MSKIGLVGNVGGQYPSAAQFKDLNPAFFRTILYRTRDLDKLAGVLPTSTKLIVLLNNEHDTVRGDWSGLEAACAELGPYKARIAAVEVGNELDLLGWQPEPAAALAVRAAPTLRRLGLPVILTSVAGSDWVNWLQAAARAAGDAVDGVALHPYGAAAGGYPSPNYLTGELDQKVEAAYQASHKPVWITEMGVKLGEVGGPEKAAEWVRRAFNVLAPLKACAAACLFAFHDANGAPFERGHHAFGLVEDGTEQKRPAYYTFASMTQARAYGDPSGTVVAKPQAAPPQVERAPFYVGEGIRDYVTKKGLTLVGNELYFTKEASATPTKEGLVFWTQGDGKARIVKWEE